MRDRTMRARRSRPRSQPFFKDLPQRIAEAHLVISRSGASTVAELAVIGRPVDPGAAARRARPGPGRERRDASATSAPRSFFRKPSSRPSASPPSIAEPSFGEHAQKRLTRAAEPPRSRHSAQASTDARRSAWRPRPVLRPVSGPNDPETRPHHETAAEARPHPLHRHRRHRHVRHRRGHAQPRLHGAGLGRRRQLQRQAARREGHQDLHRPQGRERRRRRDRRRLHRDQARQSGARRRPASGACRWCAAPRCWPS